MAASSFRNFKFKTALESKCCQVPKIPDSAFSAFARPGFRSANEKYAALNLEAVGIFEHDVGVVCLSVFRIINLARPLVCALRTQPRKNLQADNRPIAL